jgi:hypothetical protein
MALVGLKVFGGHDDDLTGESVALRENLGADRSVENTPQTIDSGSSQVGQAI